MNSIVKEMTAEDAKTKYDQEMMHYYNLIAFEKQEELEVELKVALTPDFIDRPHCECGRFVFRNNKGKYMDKCSACAGSECSTTQT